MDILGVQSMVPEQRIELGQKVRYLVPGDLRGASPLIVAQVASADQRVAVPGNEEVCPVGGAQAQCGGERQLTDQKVECLRGTKQLGIFRAQPLLHPRTRRIDDHTGPEVQLVSSELVAHAGPAYLAALYLGPHGSNVVGYTGTAGHGLGEYGELQPFRVQTDSVVPRSGAVVICPGDSGEESSNLDRGKNRACGNLLAAG